MRYLKLASFSIFFYLFNASNAMSSPGFIENVFICKGAIVNQDNILINVLSLEKKVGYYSTEFIIDNSNNSNGIYNFVPVEIDIKEKTIFFQWKNNHPVGFSISPFNGYILTDIGRVDIKQCSIDNSSTSNMMQSSKVTTENKYIIKLDVSGLYCEANCTVKLDCDFINDDTTKNSNFSIINLLLLKKK